MLRRARIGTTVLHLAAGAALGLAGGSAIAQEPKADSPPAKEVEVKFTKPVEVKSVTGSIPLLGRLFSVPQVPPTDPHHKVMEDLRASMNRSCQTCHSAGVATVKGDLLGLSITPADDVIREQLALDGKGLVVTAVASESPAGAAKLAERDIILEVAGKPVATVEELRAALGRIEDGPVPLGVLRLGERRTVELRRPAPSSAHEEQVKRRIDLARTGEYLAAINAIDEAPSYWIGVSVSPIDETLRDQLKLPMHGALVVNEVVKDSPAAKAGLRKNDILGMIGKKEHVSMGMGRPLTTSAELVSAVQEAKDKELLSIRYRRAGKDRDVEIRGEKRARGSETAGAAVGDLKNALDQTIQFYQAVPGVAPKDFRAFNPSGPMTAPNAAGVGLVWSLADPKPTAGGTEARLAELTRQVEALTKAVEALKDRLPEKDTGKK